MQILSWKRSEIAIHLFAMKHKNIYCSRGIFCVRSFTEAYFLRFELSSYRWPFFSASFSLFHVCFILQRPFFRSSIRCGWKSISFARPINVWLSYSVLIQCSCSRCGNLVVRFFSSASARRMPDCVGSRARLHSTCDVYVQQWSETPYVHSFQRSFHFKCNLPTIIYSNVLHSKYFSP